MKFTNLPKQKRLLIYMFYYEAESSNAITMSNNGDDIIAYGISKNKNSLANMLYNLRKKKLVSESILRDGSFAYPLTISGQNEAKRWIERYDKDDFFPGNVEQPNNFENNNMNNIANTMKNAFESMAKSFEIMKKSFVDLNNASSNANNLFRIQACAEAIDHNITYLVTRFDTVYNAVKNGNESPNKIIERMNEIYEGGIKYLIQNNNELKKAIPKN